MPDTVTQNAAPAPTPKEEIDALIVKHHEEINHIQALDSAGQQAALRFLGVDPKAIEEHYKDLEVRSKELRLEDAKASRNTKILGWTSMAAAIGGGLAMGKKLGSWVTRAYIIPVAALVAGFVGTYTGSRIFSGKLREDSRQLNIQARNALDRELAVALENRDRGQAPAPVTEEAPALQAAVAITPRDPSFAVQAVVDKVMAAQAQRG